MISFLKKSTFIVNDVLSDAWEVLKKRYIAIAGLCLLLFIIFNVLVFLGIYLEDIATVLKVGLFLAFVILFFGVLLTLFKHIFQVLDKNKDTIHLTKSLPSITEMTFFFVGILIFALLAFFSYLLISMVLLPLVYLRIPVDLLVNIAVSIAALFIFFMLLRLAFFPFFIIDKGQNTTRSMRLSLAITRGNLTKIVMLLAFFVMLNLLYAYFTYLNQAIISTAVSIINSFVVIPLASVAITIAYRKMMNEYHGSENPGIMKNIL